MDLAGYEIPQPCKGGRGAADLITWWQPKPRPGLAVIERWLFEAEEFEHGRRDVDDGGFSTVMRRLEKSTPGTSRGSTQWSPLQALMLSSKMVLVTFPIT